MNCFSANAECANSSLPDSLLRRLFGSGTLFATMDVAANNPVFDIIVTTTDIRIIYAVEIGIHPLSA